MKDGGLSIGEAKERAYNFKEFVSIAKSLRTQLRGYQHKWSIDPSKRGENIKLIDVELLDASNMELL